MNTHWALAGFFLLAAACEYEEGILILADGSGTITVTTRLPRALEGEELGLDLSEAGIRARLTSGLTLRSYERVEQEGDVIVRVRIAFESLSALTAIEDPVFGQRVRVTRLKGRFEYERSFPQGGLQRFVTMRFVLRVPTRIDACNGRLEGDHTAIWEFAGASGRPAPSMQATIAGAETFAPDATTFVLILVMVALAAGFPRRRKTVGKM